MNELTEREQIIMAHAMGMLICAHGCGSYCAEEDKCPECGRVSKPVPEYTPEELSAIVNTKPDGLVEFQCNAPDETLAPGKCPITGREYWGWMEHPDKGIIPLYGGPFDSYSIPEMIGESTQQWHERELVCEHYDHDAGCWKEPEILPLRVVNENYLFGLQAEKAELLEALKALVKWDTDFPASKGESYIITKLDVVIKNAYKAIAKAEGK